MGKFKPQSVNLKDVNQFVKSGAFDRQMKQHMPAIMSKVQKVDALSKGQAVMTDKEVADYVGKIAMKTQTSNITDVASYLTGVKTATILLGYEESWVSETLMEKIKEKLAG